MLIMMKVMIIQENQSYDSLQTEGTFFISDAGESHGGFEFTAEYKTEFDVNKRKRQSYNYSNYRIRQPIRKACL